MELVFLNMRAAHVDPRNVKLPPYKPPPSLEEARIRFERLPWNLSLVALVVLVAHAWKGEGGPALVGPLCYALFGVGLWIKTPMRWRPLLSLPLLCVSLYGLGKFSSAFGADLLRWPLRMVITPMLALSGMFLGTRLPAYFAGGLAVMALPLIGHVGWIPGTEAAGWLLPGGNTVEWGLQVTAIVYLIFASCTKDDKRGIFLPVWLLGMAFLGIAVSAVSWWYTVVNQSGFVAGMRPGPGPSAELFYRLFGGVVFVALLNSVRDSRIQALKMQRLNLRLDRQFQRNRRTLVQLKEAREVAVQASRAKSEFLANMSHEIRNPLNVVVGMTRLLAEGASGAARTRQISTLTHASEQLLALVSNVLDLSKIEAGAAGLAPEVFSPKKLLDSLKHMFEPQATAKGIALKVKFERDVPAWVEADVLHLKQVSVNLIGNALRFTSEGSVEVSLGFAGDFLRIEVRDSGPGVSDEDRLRLFSDYAQGSNVSTDSKRKGTGLGLSISRKLVALMGGEIGVESRLGEGSTFWFRVPVTPADAPSTRKQKFSRKSLNILVVDDDAFNREVAESTLQSLGWKAITCSRGEQALAYLAKPRRPIDAILLDRRMPGMDGLTLARKIRETGCKLPILCVTGSATLEEAEESLTAGMDAVVVKPYSRETLHREIAKLTLAPKRSGNGETKASKKLWGIFLKTMRDGLVELGRSVEAGDAAAMSMTAHRLRSSCLFLGLTDLAETCGRLEFGSADPAADLETLKRDFRELSKEGGIERSQIAA